MRRRLEVWADSLLAARLDHEAGEFRLSYTEAWQGYPGRYPFSPHLALDRDHAGATVRHFFGNLMPEGHALEGISRAHQVSRYDVFGVLAAIGRDCAGALVLVPDGEAPGGETGYRSVAPAELSARIRAQAEVPLLVWDGKLRISLAGVRDKVAVRLSPEGEIRLPLGAAPSTHILKPQAADGRLPGLPENEHFCMTLARRLGLPVPATRLLRVPESVLVVERYDRRHSDDDAGIGRLHQIDLCQALNLPPDFKYEEPLPGRKGATLAAMFEAAQLLAAPARGRLDLLRWVVFNYLTGNSDAHAKNVSFLLGPEGMRLAPFYDLVCGTVYGADSLAQFIGDNDVIGHVGAGDWGRFAHECGLSPALVARTLRELGGKAPAAAAACRAEMAAAGQDHPILEAVVADIARHAGWALQAAQRPVTP